jgi:DNA polymerase I-like protein with 3'-5' exonuclease and polymerase domains
LENVRSTIRRGKRARKRPLWNMGKNPETLKLLEEGLAGEKRNRSFGQDSRFDKTAARSPYNSEIQGSSVDIITAMIWPVQDWLDKNTDGGKFILQIYDSIMLLVRDEDVEKTLDFLIPLMKDELEPRVGYMDGVPLAVDVKVGKSWDSLTKVRKEKK